MKKLSVLAVGAALFMVAPFLANCADPLEIAPTGPDPGIDTIFTVDTVGTVDTVILNDTIVEGVDTVFLTDTLYVVDTVATVDTVIVTDTIVEGVDTVFTTDTLFVTDTVLQIDTVLTTDTLTVTDTVFQTDTVLTTDTLTVTDTVFQTDTLLTIDTLTVTDTLLQVDTVFQVDTVHTTDTVTRVDTVTVVDTVILILPPPEERHCSALDSDDHSINWVLDNDAGHYRLVFTGTVEREKPTQTLIITIDGTEYTWVPAEADEYVLELDLGTSAKVDIEVIPPPARGHSIDVCLDVTKL